MDSWNFDKSLPVNIIVSEAPGTPSWHPSGLDWRLCGSACEHNPCCGGQKSLLSFIFEVRTCTIFKQKAKVHRMGATKEHFLILSAPPHVDSHRFAVCRKTWLTDYCPGNLEQTADNVLFHGSDWRPAMMIPHHHTQVWWCFLKPVNNSVFSHESSQKMQKKARCCTDAVTSFGWESKTVVRKSPPSLKRNEACRCQKRPPCR